MKMFSICLSPFNKSDYLCPSLVPMRGPTNLAFKCNPNLSVKVKWNSMISNALRFQKRPSHLTIFMCCQSLFGCTKYSIHEVFSRNSYSAAPGQN